MANTYLTRESLLWKVKDQNDQEAWQEFVCLYQPFIKILLRGMHIPESESEDIIQDIILKLWNYIEKYDIAGSAKFRTWLISLVRNHTFNYMRKLRANRTRDDAYTTVFHTFSTDGDCLDENRFEQHYQQQWERYICNLAFETIRDKFTGKAVSVFSMTLDDKPIDEICRDLGIKKDTVYRLRVRVKQALIDEIAHLRRKFEG